jgi:type I restriction enzyme S subunit
MKKLVLKITVIIMTSILLSIKPKYIQKIIEESKKYEFRKQVFKKNVEKAYVYASSPIMKIVGVFSIGEIITKNPHELWVELKDYSGLTEDEFFEYYKNKQLGVAIEVKDFTQFEKPINPKEIIPNFKPPQSFCYLYENSKVYKILKEL